MKKSEIKILAKLAIKNQKNSFGKKIAKLVIDIVKSEQRTAAHPGDDLYALLSYFLSKSNGSAFSSSDLSKAKSTLNSIHDKLKSEKTEIFPLIKSKIQESAYDNLEQLIPNMIFRLSKIGPDGKKTDDYLSLEKAFNKIAFPLRDALKKALKL